MTADMIELAAELCAGVLGVQLAAIAVVCVMDFMDCVRRAAERKANPKKKKPIQSYQLNLTS